jgi:hypothetical protein
MPTNCKAPVLNRKIWGRKLWGYRICPYATQDSSGRIPDAEKSNHITTSGAMALHTVDGHNQTFLCTDNNCSFYTGTATTSIILYSRVQSVVSGTSYQIDIIETPITPCSGVRFYES